MMLTYRWYKARLRSSNGSAISGDGRRRDDPRQAVVERADAHFREREKEQKASYLENRRLGNCFRQDYQHS